MTLAGGFIHMAPAGAYDAGAGLRASADALEAEWTAASGTITTEEAGIGAGDIMAQRFREHYDTAAEAEKRTAAGMPRYFRNMADRIQRDVDEYLATEEENRRGHEPPR